MPVETFRAKLMTLRADGLMSANLSGSFDAVLEQLSAAQRGVDGVGSANALDAARAGVVDAESLEQLMKRMSLSDKHTKAIGEVDKDLVYTPIAPCNLMDTRPGVSPVPPEGGPALAAGYAVRVVQVTGRCTVPTGAKGIAALYTIENIPSLGGVVFAGDAGGTGGAVVSWSAPSQYSSGSGITPLSTAGAMQLQSAGGTHIKVDVTGYFMPPTRNGDGLRVSLAQHPSTVGFSPNVINGSSNNGINNSSGQMFGATIAGGYNNIVGDATGINGWRGTISGGEGNRVTSDNGTVSGGRLNSVDGSSGTISGGFGNTVTGSTGTVPGGQSNVAGTLSFAAGNRAKATDQGSFVWADSLAADYASNGNNSFNVRAQGGVHLNPSTSMFFGTQTRQNLNLFAAAYGIGVQANTLYYRSATYHVWHRGGSHSDFEGDPGAGGSTLMTLRPSAVPGTVATGALYAQSFNPTSDRDSKQDFKSVSGRSILNKLLTLPMSTWTYKTDSATQHIGPVAQDFKKVFGLKGASDKSIATVDADGIAFAAIQGLNQKLVNSIKAKDAELAKLRAEMAIIKKKLGL